jgi:hypothetical protein
LGVSTILVNAICKELMKFAKNSADAEFLSKFLTPSVDSLISASKDLVYVLIFSCSVYDAVNSSFIDFTVSYEIELVCLPQHLAYCLTPNFFCFAICFMLVICFELNSYHLN